MASYTNRVFDAIDADFVEWDTSPYPDPTGIQYTGSGVFGVDTSDYTVASKSVSPADGKNSVRFVVTSTSPGYSGGGTNVLTATSSAVFPTQDGVTPALGDSLLLTDLASAASADNGIYIITVLGSGAAAWEITRRVDANSSALVTSMLAVNIEEGTIYAPGTLFKLTTPNPITLNTTALTFADGTGESLQRAYEGGNTVDITSAEGVITASNSTDATNLLTLNRTFVGSGDGLNVNMGPGDEAVSGRGIEVVGGAGTTGALVYIANNGGSADPLFVVSAEGVLFRIHAAGAISSEPTSGQDFTVETAGVGSIDLSSASGNIVLDAASAEVQLSHLGGITRILGDFVIEGTTVRADSENVLLADNHLYLNNGYETAAAQTGGLIVNYLPIATTDTVAATGFVAGSGSGPVVNTVGTAFVQGQFIQITGASEPANNGLFEVEDHTGSVLEIRGVGGTSTVEDFTQNQFVTDTTVAGTITRLNVAVLRANTSGEWEVASGATTGLTFTNAQTLQGAYEGGNAIAVTTAEGTVALSNSADLTDLLSLDRTFVGAGSGLDVNMGPGNEAVTGVGVSISSGTGATGTMLEIVNEGSGAALEVHDGVGNPVFVVNDDGSIEMQPTTGTGITASLFGAGAVLIEAVDGNITADTTTGDVVLQRAATDAFHAASGSTAINHPTLLTLNIAGTPEAALNASALQLGVPLFQFALTEVTPTINQEDETGGSVAGDQLLIHAQNSTGVTAPGGALLLKGGTGTTTGGTATLQGALGTVTDGQTLLLSADGTGAIGMDQDGVANVLAVSGQDVVITAAAAGDVVINPGSTGDLSLATTTAAAILSGHGGTPWTHAGDFQFDLAETAPVITQVAVVDVLGETLSLLGQSNNSATLKAGDVTVAGGTNAGAGADGDTIIGNGTAQIEIDDNKLGFFTVTPIVRPDVTGSRGGNAALADLLTQLESLGLITDSTT